METTKITNGLLTIIALAVIWIALKPIEDTPLGAMAVVRSAAAQAEVERERNEEPPLQVLCTLSNVDEAAARALVGEFQHEVITALNQTNHVLGSMQASEFQHEVIAALNQANHVLGSIQAPFADLPQVLDSLERALQKIAKNTSSYQ